MVSFVSASVTAQHSGAPINATIIIHKAGDLNDPQVPPAKRLEKEVKVNL
jgi:hypothetical protein